MKKKKRVCIVYGCDKMPLKRVFNLHSIQTANGFFTNRTGETRYICPCCGSFYV